MFTACVAFLISFSMVKRNTNAPLYLRQLTACGHYTERRLRGGHRGNAVGTPLFNKYSHESPICKLE